MHRRGLLVVLAVMLSLVGCKANPPAGIEVRLINATKHRVTVGNRSEKNPLQVTPETIADGKEAFSHYCIACHGLDGQNTGVPFADRMSPPVPSLASREVQGYTDGQLSWVINYGIAPSGMPGSKGILSDDEIWSIVVFLRHLPRAGSLGEPDVYNH